jgi:hypothetical protein
MGYVYQNHALQQQALSNLRVSPGHGLERPWYLVLIVFSLAPTSAPSVSRPVARRRCSHSASGLWPNDRPVLGVELDMKQLKMISEVTQPVTNRAQTYFRPDGSITNW